MNTFEIKYKGDLRTTAIHLDSGSESLSSLEYVNNKWSIYMHKRTEQEYKGDDDSRIEMTNKELYKDLIAEFKILQDK